MIPSLNGYLTSFCPNKIKISELNNVVDQASSINELNLPSPRLMHINFEKVNPIHHVERYQNEVLRGLIPSLFSSKREKSTTFYQLKREPVSKNPFKFDINDILRRATGSKKGNRDMVLLSHVTRENTPWFNNDREKVGYLTKHFCEFQKAITQ